MARSSSVISRPTTGGATGRCRATGSSSATSPSRAMSASSVAVNVFVIEPISNTESGGTPRLQTPVSPRECTATTTRVCRVLIPPG